MEIRSGACGHPKKGELSSSDPQEFKTIGGGFVLERHDDVGHILSRV